jgi:hypothetical protein
MHNASSIVIPAKAGTQRDNESRSANWIPAFAGMTKVGEIALG